MFYRICDDLIEVRAGQPGWTAKEPCCARRWRRAGIPRVACVWRSPHPCPWKGASPLRACRPRRPLLSHRWRLPSPVPRRHRSGRISPTSRYRPRFASRTRWNRGRIPSCRIAASPTSRESCKIHPDPAFLRTEGRPACRVSWKPFVPAFFFLLLDSLRATLTRSCVCERIAFRRAEIRPVRFYIAD